MGGTGTTGGRAPRTDIQGLRTIAVLSVLVYHVTPTHLTGGFVGVDIFFVISGFLITAHLLARPPATVSDFLGFWGRRVRRLLPASLLVLVVTVAATRLVGPETLWENTARQAAAAGLYFVNWLLASDAVDYLAAENVATPVQHYWSLSVEEQFYLVWPLLIGLLVWIALRARVRRAWVLSVGMGAVFAASLAWSVHLTATEPGAAYFVTPTRIWELAAGGLVALWFAGEGSGRPAVRAVIAWAGIALMAWSILTYDATTVFPSWTAGIPVLGACLVLAAAAGTQWWSPGALLALRPMQWVGDISYSLYLWHWPLVVLVSARYNGLGWLDGSAVVVLSIVLAALTKKYVEDPFRTATWNRRLGATYAWGLVGMVLVLVASGALWKNVQNRQEVAEKELASALAVDDPCLGAGALDPALDCAPAAGPVVPTPAQALLDKSDAYSAVSGGKDCWSAQPVFRLKRCEFGVDPADSRATVMVFGNSHAGQWLPALQEQAPARKWHIVTRLASRCASSDTDQNLDGDGVENCRAWTMATADRIIEESPDLVVMTNRMSTGADGKGRANSGSSYRDGYVRVLKKLTAANVPVLVLADTPSPGDNGVDSIPDCLAAQGTDSSGCDGPRSGWITPEIDPAQQAVAAVDSPLVKFANLNDRICGEQTCQAVVGGVIVYFDASHLTATFASTLGPALGQAITASGLLATR